MTGGENEVVFDAEGVRGTLEAPINDAGTDGRARVLLADGRRLRLPPDALERREHGTLVFRGSFEELTTAVVVPVVEEEPRITRRRTEGRETHRDRLLGEEVSVESAGVDDARPDAEETQGGGRASRAAARH
ncbi:MAG TPA: hypothetical protein VN282_01060 [Pyrinomonadaceae bacterium]|nr:hypothetical protein [Pyrinomonadaceae bacterium]